MLLKQNHAQDLLHAELEPDFVTYLRKNSDKEG